jgi:hypothetical protein
MSVSNFKLPEAVKTALLEYLNKIFVNYSNCVSTEPLGFDAWEGNGRPHDWVLVEYAEITHDGNDVKIYAFADVTYGNVALCVESIPTGDTANLPTYQCATGHDTATIDLDATTAVANHNYGAIGAPFDQCINIITAPAVTKFSYSDTR